MDKSSMILAEIKSGGVKCYLWKENIVSVRGERTLYPVAKINNYRSEEGTKTSKRNNG